MYDIFKYIEGIQPSNTSYAKRAENYLDGLTKPVGSLGKLEEIYMKLSAVQETTKVQIDKKVVIIMCSDNGVYEEQISECPQEITATVTYNFTRDITGISRFSAFSHSDIHIVDVGVKGDFDHPLIHNKKIRQGTWNMTKGPAMTREETILAIYTGIEVVKNLKEKGYTVFGTGEMGIGNTTTSAAVLCTLTGAMSEVVVGKGAGARKETLERKLKAISMAITVNKPEKEDVLDVLSKVGGFDIAALCGVYIGASYYKKAVVIDGFIAAVAALCAYRLNPLVKDYMFPSHHSKEKGMELVMKELGLEAYFDLDMRLGEGTGCPITFNLMDMSLFVLGTMGTFEEAHVPKEKYMNIWK